MSKLNNMRRTATSLSYQIFLHYRERRNEGNIRGVALRAEPRTNVSLVKCKFISNFAGSLGVVFNRGTMNIVSCEFLRNSGNVSHSCTETKFCFDIIHNF